MLLKAPVEKVVVFLVTTVQKWCVLYVECTIPWCCLVLGALSHRWAMFQMYSLCLYASAWDLRLCVPLGSLMVMGATHLCFLHICPSVLVFIWQMHPFRSLVSSQIRSSPLAHTTSLWTNAASATSEVGFQYDCCSSLVGHGLAPLAGHLQDPGGLCLPPPWHFNLVFLHCWCFAIFCHIS